MILKIFSFLIFWFVLSGYKELFFITCGIFSSVLALLFIWRLGIFPNKKGISFLSLIKYFPWLFSQVLMSNIYVLIKVWNFNSSLNSSFSLINLPEYRDDNKITLLANSITFTPGTISVEVNKPPYRIRVHALDSELLPGVIDIKKKVESLF